MSEAVDLGHAIIKKNYYVEKPYDFESISEIHWSMRNEKFNETYYRDLRLAMVKAASAIGRGKRVNNKGKVVPVFRDSHCVKTGYDILDLSGRMP